MRIHLFPIVAVLCLVALPATAQNPKPVPLPSGELFFTAKEKQPAALERFYPGLVAAILLTDEQKLGLIEAARTTIGDDDLRTAAQEVKSNPNATEAQRENVRMLHEQARERISAVVEQILTRDQKAVVARIQQAYNETTQAARRDLEPEFGLAKGDAKRTAAARDAYQATLKVEFARRLDAIFSPEQKTAVEQAAKAQAEREERAAQSKKGK